jgi:GT2 family glycosyltransferase
MDAQSTDGSTTTIEGLSGDHLRVVPNAGFSASNNRGIELTSAPFVLLLNPDAMLGDHALESLLETASDNPRAAIIGAAVYNPDGSARANS